MIDVNAKAEELLERARGASSGRAAESLLKVGPLRQTLLALADGSELAEHDAPGPGSVHVLRGAVVFRFGAGESARLPEGAVWPLVQQRHSVVAEGDAAFILTVVVAD